MPTSFRYNIPQGNKPAQVKYLGGFALPVFVNSNVPLYAYELPKAKFSSISRSLFSV